MSFRQLTCVLAVVASASGLVACGGSSDSGNEAGASSGSQGNEDRGRVRLTACLRKQGVDIPENPGQGGPPQNFDRDKLQRAIQGPCKKYQGQAFGNQSEQERSEFRDQLTKFTSCMRQNGVDIPDMNPGEGGPPPRIDQDDPKVEKATQACRSKLPNGGRGGPGGPGQ